MIQGNMPIGKSTTPSRRLILTATKRTCRSGTSDNIRIALIKLKIILRYDLFAARALIEQLPGFGPALDDAAATRLWMQMDQCFKLQPTKDMLADVLTDTAWLNAFHPVRDYLDALQWDGQPRLDTWLSDYGNAPDTKYVAAVGALTLIAAVRRVRWPGCKFDEMLVLEGVQGSSSSMPAVVCFIPSKCLAHQKSRARPASRVFAAIRKIIEASPLLCNETKMTADKIVFPAFLQRHHQHAVVELRHRCGRQSDSILFDELWAYSSLRSSRLFDEMVPPPTR